MVQGNDAVASAKARLETLEAEYEVALDKIHALKAEHVRAKQAYDNQRAHINEIENEINMLKQGQLPLEEEKP